MKPTAKAIFLILGSLMISTYASAAINLEKAKSVLATEYVVSEGGREFKFKISSAMKIVWDKDSPEKWPESNVDLRALEDSELMGTLPIAVITLVQRSDEQAEAIVVRLSFREKQDKVIYLQVVDAIQTFNDGPNEMTAVNHTVVQVKRLSKFGKFIPIRKF